MSRSITEITALIDAIAPVVGEYEGWTQADLDALSELTDAYFANPEASNHLAVWFRLFERFPESDGYKIFWSILHGLERFEHSADMAVASVRHKPSHFPVLMINRLLNGRVRETAGADLIRLLEEVAGSSSALPSVRADAASFLEYQRTKT